MTADPQATDSSYVYDSEDLAIPSFTVPPHPSETKTPRSPCCRRIICIATILGIVVVGAIGILMTITGGEGPQAIFVQEDPPGIEDTNRWTSNRQRGLDLFVMNSCEDRWTPIFNEYIQAWDNGSPDALTLTSQKFPHDPECAEHSGRVNVCNGNYGNTEWRGINTAFIQGDFVRHSVAKLNDYHLDRESEAQKRYTMCHELGHAFGLPHTDENYYNFDRGDCLDYTTRPRNNLQPGEFNFNLLYSLYGSAYDVAASPTTSTTLTREQDPQQNEEDAEKEEEDDRRRLGAPRSQKNRLLEAPKEEDDTPDAIKERYAAVRACLEEFGCGECMEQAFFDYDGDRRMLHKDEQGEACEFDLGDGYMIQTHKLLVRSVEN